MEKLDSRVIMKHKNELDNLLSFMQFLAGAKDASVILFENFKKWLTIVLEESSLKNLNNFLEPFNKCYSEYLPVSVSIKGIEQSVIATSEKDKDYLRKWLYESIGVVKELNLLWKGTRDGANSFSFHSKCNNKGPTLTLIKSTSDKIFGGYTSFSWKTESCGYHYDSTAFIFSLTNAQKFDKQKDTACSIRNQSGWTVMFGNGIDIAIADNCISNNASYSQINGTYNLPSNEFLAGSRNFQVMDIEVFSVTK